MERPSDTDKAENENACEFTYQWTVYDARTRDYIDAFETDHALDDLTMTPVIATVFKHLPQTKGRSFCVNDEQSERIYIMWTDQEDVYDEYVSTGWTSMQDVDEEMARSDRE